MSSSRNKRFQKCLEFPRRGENNPMYRAFYRPIEDIIIDWFKEPSNILKFSLQELEQLSDTIEFEIWDRQLGDDDDFDKSDDEYLESKL
jgi:hypothetical protein